MFQFFPLIFFEFIENEDKVRKLLILFQEVVDIIYASKFTEPMLKYFEELYVEFMTNANNTWQLTKSFQALGSNEVATG